ncbi:hypothetical protein CDL12_11954 [Handroanthus impetiginosus]|uniref:Uncharacterized protein n=1 Tax=Handroanthus impetiginosus TaxID=429701 RepID=A0A2G9HCZ7_9LAMI|nr:hypothetical protein CDL12_11954 [Handroanthus impetiginosus]
MGFVGVLCFKCLVLQLGREFNKAAASFGESLSFYIVLCPYNIINKIHLYYSVLPVKIHSFGSVIPISLRH